jgi:hypothetical protein
MNTDPEVLAVYADDRVELWGESVGVLPGAWSRFIACTDVRTEATRGSWRTSEDSGWYGLGWGRSAPDGSALWLHLRHKTEIFLDGVEQPVTPEAVVEAFKAWLAAPFWTTGWR